MKIELAAYSPRGCSVRKLTSRPPDMRISFVGFINRNKASTFKQYIGVSSFVPSSFVPSIGFKKLTGIESASNSFNEDRKSTRLNSSHVSISYAVFCLKKKTNKN